MNVPMDDNQRLQLQNMIKTNNIEDQTELIRKLRHSEILISEINALLLLKKKYNDIDLDQESFQIESLDKCNFLFTYYTDLFNKIKKNEIDLGILNKFLNVLQMIENGEVDQHEGSFMVGTLLKEIYVDSALRKAEKLNEKEDAKREEPVLRGPEVNISWKQYKLGEPKVPL
jgi:hypothetical protein